jgi:hypothetical protein
MLFEAARFQEDPQLKSLTASSDFRADTSPNPDLSTIPQIDEALAASHGFLSLDLRSAALETIPTFTQLQDPPIRHAALFRKCKTTPRK